MEKAIILHARTYNFTDDRTNKQISGLKMSYILTDELEPLKIDDNERGYSVAEASLPIEIAAKISAIPGVYDIKFISTPNAKKQIVQKPVDLTYICTVPDLYFAKPTTTK